MKDNPKKLWGYVNKKMKTKQGIPNLIKEEDKNLPTKDDSERAEFLAGFFSSVFTKEPEGH